MSECVPWQGTIRPDGYGQLYVKGKPQLAHRVAWALEYGAYPDYPREVIDHLCRTRSCVNVEHMELTTIGENVLRGDTLPAWEKAQTHCKRGHDLSKAYTAPGKRKRQCMKCQEITKAARKAQKVGQ